MIAPLQLIPEYRDYVWGGMRLRPAERTAEAWVVYAGNRIAAGPYAGQTLADAAAQLGPDLLGQPVVRQTGLRFPLLVKLLDCADWLSLQVHPNDEQAARLEGPDHFGKTEAWHVIAAEPPGELLFGFKPGAQPADLSAAVRGGTVLDLVQRHNVQAGDTVFIRPGMIHALGPGLLIYEVQQTSNITYRVYDWGRPASAGRALHIEQSLAVLDPQAKASILPRPALPDGAQENLVSCEFFNLHLLAAQHNPVALDTHGASFHTLTAISGQARVEGAGWSADLRTFESLVIPAAAGAYQLLPQGEFSALCSFVPGK